MIAFAAFFVGPIGRWLVVAALVASSVFAAAVHERNIGWNERDLQARNEAEAARVEYAKQVTAIQARQQEVITKTVTVYRDKIVLQKEKDDAIQKDIESHVLDSPLLAGWVRYDHDAAAVGDLSGNPLGAVGSAPPVETNSLLSAVAENYSSCRAEYEKLIALQTIVKSLESKP